MSSTLIISTLLIYFCVLIFIAWYTSRGADTDAFFSANRQSPWYLVAFGMIGASLSGVTFISVPGNVGKIGFAYYQIVLGYLLGYLVIATILMPLYYRLNLISIYTYLEQRFGKVSYKTGALFFLLSRTLGSALRLFIAADVLQFFLFSRWNVPFEVTVGITIVLIWVYTFRGGIKTIVWTDTFQTFFLVSAVLISVIMISRKMNLDFPGLLDLVSSSKYSNMFYWDDFKSKLFFPKYFIGGAFLAIVMTGLDQDLMQKNLTCKNIGEAQKNMFWFCIIMALVNLLFLTLGAMLYLYSESTALAIPPNSDHLFPSLALEEFGLVAGLFFLLGITASSYASADSALAALTTSFCIDFLDFKNKNESLKNKQKNWVHVGFSVLFFLIIVVFSHFKQKSLIDYVLDFAAYTYGALLGLFAYGLLTKRKLREAWVPVVAVLAPTLTYLLVQYLKTEFSYYVSTEAIVLNGCINLLGLHIISYKQESWKTGNQ
ncbi:MAG: sodium:solute symporter [Cytophagaceae bacterium]|jgi:Na+/proline symporter|nr:sodium:solute symporter [Cytophagaceae bacterium]